MNDDKDSLDGGQRVRLLEREVASLREREAYLRVILETATDAIITIDDQIRIHSVNPAIERILGYTPAELIGRSLVLLMPERFREAFLRAMDRLLAGTLTTPPRRGAEFPGLHKDGYEVPLEISYGRAQLNGSSLIIGIMRDISARKRAEHAVRASEEALRTIFNSTYDAIILHDRDGTILDVNDSMQALFGVSHAEALRLRIIEDLSGATSPTHALPHLWTKVLAGQPQVFQWRSRRPHTGEEFDAQVYLRKLTLHGRDVIMANVHDITERQRDREALEREKAFLSTAIDLLPFPILFISEDHTVLRANQASQMMTRYLHDHQKGGIPFYASDGRTLIPEEERPLQRALRGEVVNGVEGVITSPDGLARLDVMVFAAPIRLEGQPGAAVMALQDITQIKAADHAKDQFLSILSHELKTPLTSIIGWGQMAQQHPEVATRALETITENARELRSMLDRLLTLSFILTGRLELRRESVDLWELVADIAEHYRPAVADKGGMLLFEPPPTPLPVSVDRSHMRQAFAELMANALAYIGAGDTITVTGAREEGWARISVRDTGRGIAPEDRERIFHPFLQLRREEAIGGYGIGLALVRGIIEAHAGTVTVASAGSGHGSIFTVEVPLATT